MEDRFTDVGLALKGPDARLIAAGISSFLVGADDEVAFENLGTRDP
jgi:hypothetical protein